MKLVLHPSTRAQVENLDLASPRSYIFHGPRGTGKASMAYELVRRLGCQGDVTGSCAACRRLQAGANPDMVGLAPADKPSITIEQVRSVIHALTLSTHTASGQRVVIVDEAQALTVEAQNALLKVIEEPPARTSFILVAEYAESLLPTIRSRCAAVYFAPVPEAQIVALLNEQHGLSPDAAKALAVAALGSPGLAVTWARQPELAAVQLELARRAQAVPSMNLFARLLLAKKLTDNKSNPTQFASLLQASLTASLITGAPAADISPQLEALERFRARLHAKVAPRATLEALMVEL